VSPTCTHAGDTPTFLGGAERLLDREPLLGRDGAYIGYIALVTDSARRAR
jgi:hypothetical protein